MTKAQLEEYIARMEKEMKELRHRYDVEQKAHKEELHILKESHNKTILDIQNKKYSMWREANGDFVKRYICELLQTNAISFNFDSTYGGYVDMNVLVDDEVQHCTNFQVCMARDYEY